MVQPEPHLEVGAPAALKLQAPHRIAIPNEVSEMGFSCPCFVSDPIRSMVPSAMTADRELVTYWNQGERIASLSALRNSWQPLMCP